MVVQNNGRVPLTLRVPGRHQRGRRAGDLRRGRATGKSFRIPFSSVEIGVGSSKEIEIVYSPPVDESVASHIDHLVQLTLTTLGGAEDESTAVITLKGRAISGACEIESPLQFGWVSKNNTMTKEVQICNKATIEATAFIDNIKSNSGDDLAFRFAAESAQGTVAIPPGACAKAVIEFTPTLEKVYFSSVYMQASEQCALIPIELHGRGVDAVLPLARGEPREVRDAGCPWRLQDNFIDCGAVDAEQGGHRAGDHPGEHGDQRSRHTPIWRSIQKPVRLHVEGRGGRSRSETQVEVPARADGSEEPGRGGADGGLSSRVSQARREASSWGPWTGRRRSTTFMRGSWKVGRRSTRVPSTLLNFGPVRLLRGCGSSCGLPGASARHSQHRIHRERHRPRVQSAPGPAEPRMEATELGVLGARARRQHGRGRVQRSPWMGTSRRAAWRCAMGRTASPRGCG